MRPYERYRRNRFESSHEFRPPASPPRPSNLANARRLPFPTLRYPPSRDPRSLSQDLSSRYQIGCREPWGGLLKIWIYRRLAFEMSYFPFPDLKYPTARPPATTRREWP